MHVYVATIKEKEAMNFNTGYTGEFEEKVRER